MDLELTWYAYAYKLGKMVIFLTERREIICDFAASHKGAFMCLFWFFEA